jgi:hypothetical protein
MIIIGIPVAIPNTTGSNQFQLAGRDTDKLIILKKKIKRCGQKAMAKNIPSMKAHSPLLRPSKLCIHFFTP